MRAVHDAGAGFSYERREHAPAANGLAYPKPKADAAPRPGTPAAKSSAPLAPPLPVAPAVQPART